MSAIAQDLEAARAAGIRVRLLQVYAFAISGAIVGSAGFVAAPVISISADSGIIYVVNGFIAAVIVSYIQSGSCRSQTWYGVFAVSRIRTTSFCPNMAGAKLTR